MAFFILVVKYEGIIRLVINNQQQKIYYYSKQSLSFDPTVKTTATNKWIGRPTNDVDVPDIG